MGASRVTDLTKTTADSVRNIIHTEVMGDENSKFFIRPFVGVDESGDFIVAF